MARGAADMLWMTASIRIARDTPISYISRNYYNTNPKNFTPKFPTDPIILFWGGVGEGGNALRTIAPKRRVTILFPVTIPPLQAVRKVKFDISTLLVEEIWVARAALWRCRGRGYLQPESSIG